jgi:hypothetical protein
MLWYGYSRTLFTADFAVELLQRAGFEEVRECAYRETGSGIAEIVELDNREDESLFVEGAKPRASRRSRKARKSWKDASRGYNPAVARREAIKVVEVAGAEPQGGLRQSHLDAPTAGSELESNAMKIVGWAVGKEQPVSAVEVVAGGEVVATAALEIERPGVASAYPDTPGADRAGFRLVVQGSGEGRHELTVRGVVDGERAPIGSIVLEIRRRGLLSRLFG